MIDERLTQDFVTTMLISSKDCYFSSWDELKINLETSPYRHKIDYELAKKIYDERKALRDARCGN